MSRGTLLDQGSRPRSLPFVVAPTLSERVLQSTRRISQPTTEMQAAEPGRHLARALADNRCPRRREDSVAYPRAPHRRAIQLASMFVAWVATATPVHSEPSPEIPTPPVTPAEAPTPRGTLDLDTAIKLALEHNPSLAAAAWHARSAALNTRSESKVPNLSLDLTEENFGWDLGSSHRETTISASQTLELGGDRGSRRKIALGQEQVAAAEWTSRQRDVIAETSSAFLDAWWLERRIRNARIAAVGTTCAHRRCACGRRQR
jgi:hypothetical protein